MNANRVRLIAAGVVLALIPWLNGGRDHTSMLITVFALLGAGIIAIARPNALTVASTPLRWAIGAWLGWGAVSLFWSVNRYQSELWLLISLIAVIAGLL